MKQGAISIERRKTRKNEVDVDQKKVNKVGLESPFDGRDIVGVSGLDG